MSQTLTLNNGVKIPSLGLGVYQIPHGRDTENAVLSRFTDWKGQSSKN